MHKSIKSIKSIKNRPSTILLKGINIFFYSDQLDSLFGHINIDNLKANNFISNNTFSFSGYSCNAFCLWCSSLKGLLSITMYDCKLLSMNHTQLFINWSLKALVKFSGVPCNITVIWVETKSLELCWKWKYIWPSFS